MNKREARAKRIVEAIVADLNKKHSYELFIRYDTNYIQLESGRLLDSLSVRWPNHELDNIGGSFCLIAVDDKATYVRLLTKMLNNIMMYQRSAGYDSKRIFIESMPKKQPSSVVAMNWHKTMKLNAFRCK